MPVRIVGMIGVTPPSNDTTLHVIEGGLSSSYLTQFWTAYRHPWFVLAIPRCGFEGGKELHAFACFL